ncbi:hypothetical protein RB614_03980 [Phytohabitans sp. ZYX-F-186]|uniref:Nephrocystin 3-like N-terminal domain-containing protein n=1 Tax=Phytohabitans maris TaxID=3071409 RepID=A0ABU0Z9H0_9ACTN|nr:hypothetical protein [Phytohabitans sp. ZYX-F-186]MDQ7903674.1 hypothetical protein [Phytohabitans sp. ZYX-F-186]
MVVELLTMLGGALLGPPAQAAFSQARKRSRRCAPDVERALVESYLYALRAVLRRCRSEESWKRDANQVKARVDRAGSDAPVVLGLAGGYPGVLRTFSEREVGDLLIDRLLGREEWLGGAPDYLVAHARELLLPSLVAHFARKVSDDDGLFRQLMVDLAVATGRDVQRVAAGSVGVQSQLSALLARVDAAALEVHEDVARLAEEVAQVRAMTDELIGRWRVEQIGELPVPARFRSLIADKTEGFVGREYVFREIDEWMSSHRSGYAVIRADPGAGKSAILAEYVRRTGCPAYFNQRANATNRADQFLRSMIVQLRDRLGAPPRAFEEQALSSGEVLAELLDELAEHDALLPMTIVVDALDEVDLSAQGAASNVLYLPAQLPAGVHLLVSRREATVPLRTDSPLHTLSLGDPRFADDVRHDVAAYVRRTAGNPGVRQWIEQRRLTVDGYVERLVHNSGGNFMYLRHVTRDIADGRYAGQDLDAIPETLQGYYLTHWHLMGMARAAGVDLQLKVLYVLLEYAEPISVPLIAKILREPAVAVQAVLADWRQFLHAGVVDGTTRYAIYHESFADFLRQADVVSASRIDLAEINGMIALCLYEQRYAER